MPNLTKGYGFIDYSGSLIIQCTKDVHCQRFATSGSTNTCNLDTKRCEGNIYIVNQQWDHFRILLLVLWKVFTFYYIYLACTVGDNYQFTAGDGTTQGSCGHGELCQADGTCKGIPWLTSVPRAFGGYISHINLRITIKFLINFWIIGCDLDNQCLYGYDCVDGKCVKESGVSQLDKYSQKLYYLPKFQISIWRVGKLQFLLSRHTGVLLG